jgi:hypothetical protein
MNHPIINRCHKIWRKWELHWPIRTEQDAGDHNGKSMSSGRPHNHVFQLEQVIIYWLLFNFPLLADDFLPNWTNGDFMALFLQPSNLETARCSNEYTFIGKFYAFSPIALLLNKTWFFELASLLPCCVCTKSWFLFPIYWSLFGQLEFHGVVGPVLFLPHSTLGFSTTCTARQSKISDPNLQ